MNASPDMVYLDHAATTPPDPAVVDAMHRSLSGESGFGNPASTHVAGRRARAAVEQARARLAALLHTDPGNLVWTSGATEADNLAILGAARLRAHRGRHLITMRTEHKAVADACAALERQGFEVTWLAPERHGRLDLTALEQAFRDDTQLVSIMHVNNETGVIQDLRAIGERCRDRNVLFHCDAAQSVGKLPVDLSALPVDLLSMTAHKFHGPQGIGALYLAPRPECRIEPLLYGGGQERRLRPGTLPVHQAVGMGVAAELAAARLEEDLRHYARLNERLWRGLESIEGVVRNGGREHAFPGILNVSIAGIEGESLLLALEPVCVARGSACNAQSGEPSHVLRALGRSDHLAQSAIRFSFGRETTEAEVDFACRRYAQAVAHLRTIMPATAVQAA
ncbi:MAG TPA: aminotransferase class V-fold PLP-dependent enzyme [Woeseiaceae bacterium]|nr:aminotransferase class V-fold PLP-dependent enzyme [Woeseiaceae bacterium]